MYLLAFGKRMVSFSFMNIDDPRRLPLFKEGECNGQRNVENGQWHWLTFLRSELTRFNDMVLRNDWKALSR